MQSDKQINRLIEQIKETIIQHAHPKKIILFGSFAKGIPGPDSDLDLLIIKESSLRRDERAKQIHKLFKPYPYPMDILVYTPQEVLKYQKIKNSFISQIIDQGKVIYEG